jgi:hypothetical protein
MFNFFKNLFGISQLEQELNSKIQQLDSMKENLEKIQQQFSEKPVTPESVSAKEQATLNKEPYITVLDTHVNPDNIRTGFLELDWNEYFILQLRENGYTGDTEEAIVDAWFQELCRNIGDANQIDMSRRGSGYVNINSLGNGKSEIG